MIQGFLVSLLVPFFQKPQNLIAGQVEPFSDWEHGSRKIGPPFVELYL